MSKWIRALSDSDGIDLLADVDTTTSAPVTGEHLEWDGTNWVPGTAGGGGGSALVGVDVATTEAGTLGTPYSFDATATIDNVVLQEGDTILIKDQATASENGVYTVGAVNTAPTRRSDLNTGASAIGVTVSVAEGEENVNTTWLCQAPAASDTVGTHDLTWRSISSHTIAGGAFRASTTAGTPASGAVRFNTATKGSITSVDLAYTPTIGPSFDGGGDGRGAIGGGTVLSFQNMRDPRDTVTVRVDTLASTSGYWDTAVTYLGQSGPATIQNTDLYTCVIMGGSLPATTNLEMASPTNQPSTTQRYLPHSPAFTSRTAGDYLVNFTANVTGLSSQTLTWTIRRAVSNIDRTYTQTVDGWFNFHAVITLPSNQAINVGFVLDTGTATLADVELTILRVGDTDW